MILPCRGRLRPVFLACFALLLLVPLLAGCGGAARARVSGRVLFQDKPLPGGWVTFRPADPRENAITAAISPEGNYEATLPVGEVQISVDNRHLQPRPAGQALTPPEGLKLPEGMPRPSAPAAPPKETERDKPAGNYVAIPEKYYTTDSSGLKYTVTKGDQKHDIPLK
jgi:hypothetical protein